ncbi:MAG: protein kinase [Planctomycetota bacterium]
MTALAREDGPDTALARRLHERGLVDYPTLQRCLAEVRALRGRGATGSLAGLLLQRRLVDPGQLSALEMARPAAGPAGGFELPVRLGPYERGRPLGQGGMGAVFEVRHVLSGARFALKTITLPLEDDDEERLRFRREAELAVLLDHPHVVRVLDYDLKARVPWIVQELLPGGSLKDLLAERGPLSPERTRALGVALADALAHAHERGVIHRDLKPDNVLFDAAGEPRIADFGLARSLASDATRLTQTGVALGTPGYMAPEQVTGAVEHGPQADVYGLGGVLYACLTGRPPFARENVFATLQAVIHDPPPRPSQAGVEVPRELDELIARCLAKDPAERPLDGAALRALLSGEAALRPLGSGARRAGLAAVVLGAAGLVLAALACWPTRDPAPAPQGGTPGPTPSLAVSPAPSLAASPVEVLRLSAPPAGFTERWRLGGAAPALGQPALWERAGRVADPLGGLRRPGGLEQAFLGRATLEGEGIAVEYAGGGVDLRLQVFASLYLGDDGMDQLSPLDGALTAAAPNDAGPVYLYYGRARWLAPRLSARVTLTANDMGSLALRLVPGEATVSCEQRSGTAAGGGERVRWPWPRGETHELELLPRAPLRERFRIDGRVVDVPVPGEESFAKRPCLMVTEAEAAGLRSLRVVGECLRPDRPAAAWAPGALPAAARVGLSFARGGEGSGGPWVGLGSPALGAVLEAALDDRPEGAVLELRCRGEPIARRALPRQPLAGLLLLTRAGDEVTATLRTASDELELSACLPLPLPDGLRPGYGSDAARVEVHDAAAWGGPPDPEREAFDAACAAGRVEAHLAAAGGARATWWRGAQRLQPLLGSLRPGSGVRRGARAAVWRQELARAALRDLELAARELRGGPRRDALARALLAAGFGDEPARCAAAGQALAAEGQEQGRAALDFLWGGGACTQLAGGLDLHRAAHGVASALSEGYLALARDDERPRASWSLAVALKLRALERRNQALRARQPEPPEVVADLRRAAQLLLAAERADFQGKDNGVHAALSEVFLALGDYAAYEERVKRVLVHRTQGNYVHYWTIYADYLARAGRLGEAVEALIGGQSRRPGAVLPQLLSALQAPQLRIPAAQRALVCLTLHWLQQPGADWQTAARGQARQALRPGEGDARSRDLARYVLRALGEPAGEPDPGERPTRILLVPAPEVAALNAAADVDPIVGSLARLDPRLRSLVR